MCVSVLNISFLIFIIRDVLGLSMMLYLVKKNYAIVCDSTGW